MIEKVAHLGTAIASLVAVLMLVFSINESNNLEKQRIDIEESRTLDEWKRSALFEAVLVNGLNAFSDIESHFVKRAEQSVGIEINAIERSPSSIRLALANLVESGTVVIDADGLYVPSSAYSERLIVDYIGSAVEAMEGPLEMAHSIVEILLDSGGELDISELASRMTKKHPEKAAVVLRSGFLAAQQNQMILIDTRLGLGEQALWEATGAVKLNPATGIHLF